MSLLRVKVGPAPQTLEVVSRRPHLPQYHQIQGREANQRLHSTSGSFTNRSRYA